MILFCLVRSFGQPLKNAPSQGAFFDALGSRPLLGKEKVQSIRFRPVLVGNKGLEPLTSSM